MTEIEISSVDYVEWIWHLRSTYAVLDFTGVLSGKAGSPDEAFEQAMDARDQLNFWFWNQRQMSLFEEI